MRAPLRNATKARSLAVVLGMIAIYTAVGVDLYSRTLHSVETQLRAHCGFDRDISPAKLTVDPKTHKVDIISVRLVSDSRAEWYALGCPGKIPKADPSFVYWAKYYNLPRYP